MSKSPLEIKNLTIGYKKPLCSNINLSIEEGEFVTIMGENGCGKTTLLDSMMGINPVKEGSIEFWGEPHNSSNNLRFDQRVAWVISQKEKYSPFIKIKDYFNILAMAYENWDEGLCSELAQKFELDLSKRMYFLSMGEHSKVRLLKALSTQPKLLILDELTANLSPNSKKVLTEVLIDLFVKNKMSVLYISHFEDEALRLSDRIFTLDRNGLHKKEVKSA